jgi:hypothetical protein
MRTSLGVQEWVLWLMAFVSAALAFVVRGPRLLWAVLLAAICGFCEARITFYDDMPAESPGRTVDWLLLLPPIVLGAGYAWRQPGGRGMAAAWLGLPYGVVFAVSASYVPGCPTPCGEPQYGLVALVASVTGTILATSGALSAIAVRVLARQLRS